MAFKPFKNGDELYDDSQELIKRGEFDKARDYLIKSIDKEGGTDDVAAVQVALIDLSDRLSSMQAYQNLLTTLERLTSATTVQFGLETIDVAEMKTECELTIRKMTLLSSGDRTSGMERGQQLIALAQDFQSRIGDRSLIALSLFRKDTSVTGTTEFYNLMALAYEIMADATVGENPSQAAEYQQIAAGYRQQNGQSAEENLRRVREYSATCTCWICGRIATGEGINFYAAPAEAPKSLEDKASAAAASREGYDHIYVCKACYTAISNRSDEIANEYYQQSMREMMAMEARLQAEIAALQSQIAFARMGR